MHQYIEKRSGAAYLVTYTEAEQDEADLAYRGISDDPFDVRLDQRRPGLRRSQPRVTDGAGRIEVLRLPGEFGAAAAGQLVRAAPDGFTANMSKAKRPGKIFLDVFRNTPESTAIASWSTRTYLSAP